MSERQTDLSQFSELFRIPGGYYEPGRVNGSVDGRQVECVVHEFDLANGDAYRAEGGCSADELSSLVDEGRNRGVKERTTRDGEVIRTETFPTFKRVVTEVCPDFERENDLTVIVCVGFRELTAQFEQDFLLAELREAESAGYTNPRIIGLNAVGKGSREYGENKERCANIGFMDEVEDAEFMTRLLEARGHIGDRVVVIGHSLGYPNAMAAVQALSNINDIRQLEGDVKRQVQSVLALMPATDQPFGFIRPRFLWMVRKQAPAALWQQGRFWNRRRGDLHVPYDDSARMMFPDGMNKDVGKDYWIHGAPDSSGRFLGVTFNPMRRFDVDEILDGTRMHVFGGQQDRLVPRGMVMNCSDHAEGAAGSKPGSLEFGTHSAHSLPRRMSPEQLAEISSVLGKAFRA